MTMSKIVRTTADIFFAFIFVFGIYIVLHGHLTPGGGFQGGAVIATGFVLLLVANNVDEFKRLFSKEILQTGEAAGLCIFAGTALLAIFLGLTFYTNFLVNSGSLFGMPIPAGPNPGFLNTGGIIPIMNIAVGLEVLCGLSLILMYMTGGLAVEEGE